MYEYKIVFYRSRSLEADINQIAKQGWRVIAVTHVRKAVMVTYERLVKDSF